MACSVVASVGNPVQEGRIDSENTTNKNTVVMKCIAQLQSQSKSLNRKPQWCFCRLLSSRDISQSRAHRTPNACLVSVVSTQIGPA